MASVLTSALHFYVFLIFVCTKTLVYSRMKSICFSADLEHYYCEHGCHDLHDHHVYQLHHDLLHHLGESQIHLDHCHSAEPTVNSKMKKNIKFKFFILFFVAFRGMLHLLDLTC